MVEIETRKCVEIYITKAKGSTEETIELRNIVKDTEENKDWFQSASDVIKQIAYVFYKLHEGDIEETEVAANDGKRTTGE